MKIKLGVIFGGVSVEHEVSIISAVQAMNAIDQEKYEIIPIYIDKERNWYTGKMLMDIDIYKDFNELKKYAKRVTLYKKDGSYYLQSLGFFKSNVAEIDVIFPIVHGANVEDGTLAGYLDTIGIPYVGSRVLGSALGQDKVVMKQVFAACNLPIVPYTWFYDVEYLNDAKKYEKEIKKIGYPVIVKPATLGSSVGITVVKKDSELDEAIMNTITYDNKIVIEKVIENLVEVNCSILGNYEYQEASVLEEVTSTNEFLTYKDKYIGSSKKTGSSKGMASTSRIVPARLTKEMTEEVQEVAKNAFKALNLGGICRVDFLIDKKAKKVYLNEPNTIPGSLSFYLWEPSGKKYCDLLDEAITIAIKDYKNKSKKTVSFDTNILSNFNGTKGVKGLKGIKGIKGKLGN
ncbi:MAG TPA: D-alanine--D-alanine ligase family protein [Bacilli bacterium]|nr:D-alanine--D-alanine ligase family protein [Bacilli bacterium]